VVICGMLAKDSPENSTIVFSLLIEPICDDESGIPTKISAIHLSPTTPFYYFILYY